jgi:hypothetical protein
MMKYLIMIMWYFVMITSIEDNEFHERIKVIKSPWYLYYPGFWQKSVQDWTPENIFENY